MPLDKNTDNIHVVVRVRPMNSNESKEENGACVQVDDNDEHYLILDSKPEPKKYTFDWVAGPNTTQKDIFEFAGKPMIQACLEGYNCCIFAYGQTSAGKTYTMQGKGLESNLAKDNVHRGLQPRVFEYIFAAISKHRKDDPQREFYITCSYLEIYNENIIDLVKREI
jgi:kinesin family protein 15